MKRILSGSLLLAVFLFLNFKFSSEEKENTKPEYNLNVSVWHRKEVETSKTWRNIKRDTTVHYLSHKSHSGFRIYTPMLIERDSSHIYFIQSKLESFYKKKLLQRNFVRGEQGIYAGQNGLLKNVDTELLTVYIQHRPVNDTLSRFSVDSIRIEILLGR